MDRKELRRDAELREFITDDRLDHLGDECVVVLELDFTVAALVVLTRREVQFMVGVHPVPAEIGFRCAGVLLLFKRSDKDSVPILLD